MSAPIDKREHEFAFHLFNATRSIGMEQGSELVLQLLYLRFATETSANRLPVSSWRDFRDRLAHGAERPGRLLTATLEACLPGWSVSASQADIDDGQALSAATAALDHWDFPRADHPDALRAQASALYEAVLQVRSERLSRAGGEFETPATVARLMMGLLDSDAGVVLDPACGIATSLLEASRRPHSRLVGRDLSADAALRARMRLDLAGVDADIAVGDAFGYQAVAPESFDSVLLQPPWGQKLTEQQLATLPPLRYGKPGRSSADFVWLQLALRALGPDGRAAVLMPTGTLTRGGHGDADIRAQMLRDGLVEAVIGLPGNLLPNTGLPSCIWLLRGAAHHPVAPPVLLCSAATLAEPSTRHGLDLPDDAVTELLGIVHRWRNDPERVAAPAHLAIAVDVDELVEPGRLLPERHLSVPPTVKPVRPEPPRRLLTEVRLRNLKSFGDEQTVELAPITLIYGPNSAGKSSLLQSLLLLKQSLAANTLVTQGELTDAGSFVGALHRHDSERSLGIGLTFGALDRWEIPAGVPDPGLLRSVDFSFRSDGAGLPEQAEALISFGPHQAPFTRQPAEFGEGGDVPFGIDLDSARELFRAIGEGTLLFPFDSRMIQGEEDEAEARRMQQRRRNGDRAYKLLRDTGLEQLISAPQGLLPGGGVDLDAVMPQLRAGREPGIVNSYVNRMMQLAVGVGSELRLLMSELTYLGPLRSAPSASITGRPPPRAPAPLASTSRCISSTTHPRSTR